MARIGLGFGVRAPQDLPGYPSARVDTFFFNFEVEGDIHTPEGAIAAGGFFREEFLRQTKAKGISSQLQPLPEKKGVRALWIPTCYLDRPEYVAIDGELIG